MGWGGDGTVRSQGSVSLQLCSGQGASERKLHLLRGSRLRTRTSPPRGSSAFAHSTPPDHPGSSQPRVRNSRAWKGRAGVEGRGELTSQGRAGRSLKGARAPRTCFTLRLRDRQCPGRKASRLAGPEAPAGAGPGFSVPAPTWKRAKPPRAAQTSACTAAPKFKTTKWRPLIELNSMAIAMLFPERPYTLPLANLWLCG